MMRVLVAGDSHGDAGYIANLSHLAQARQCGIVFIVGDFGYWEHTREGGRFLDRVAEIAHEAGIDIHFIDGNHDNHPMLWSIYGEGKRGIVKVRDGLYYHGRGQRWEWDGVAFMSLGGGYSIDKEYRQPWQSWWPTELITNEDVTFSIRSGKVDILLCHDAPLDVDLTKGEHAIFKGGIRESDDNRDLLQTVINIKEPVLVIHGHMHYRYVDTIRDGRTTVIGLGHNEQPIDRTCVVLELDDAKYQIG